MGRGGIAPDAAIHSNAQIAPTSSSRRDFPRIAQRLDFGEPRPITTFPESREGWPKAALRSLNWPASRLRNLPRYSRCALGNGLSGGFRPVLFPMLNRGCRPTPTSDVFPRPLSDLLRCFLALGDPFSFPD